MAATLQEQRRSDENDTTIHNIYYDMMVIILRFSACEVAPFDNNNNKFIE